jgi:hypothetical protein
VMIGLCKQASEKENLSDRTTFIQTDLLDYTPESNFDVSFGIGLFDYISDPLPVLKRMREVSTDKAIMAFPRLWTWRAPVRKARLARKGCPVYFYSKPKIEKLLRDAGFKRQEIVKVGKLFCVVAYV